MARIEDIERRLLNWARWRAGAGSGGMGYAGVNWGSDGGTRSAYREARIPTLDCDGEEMDRAVRSLSSELRRTVEVHYCESRSEVDAMARLACGRSTLHARLGRAHLLLQAWLANQQRLRDDERARVEAIEQAGRDRLLQMRQNR